MRFFHCPLSAPPVGVDWGSRWVKIVHLHRTGKKFRLTRAVRFCWQKQQNSNQLRSAWKNFDLRKKTVFLALDSNLSLFSQTDKIDLTRNLFRIQSQRQSVPPASDHYTVNAALQDTNGKQHGLRVSVSREQIDTVKQQTEQAGLRVEVLDNKMLALCNAYSFAYADTYKMPAYLLHLGHQASYLIFYRAGIPVWIEKLELSGNFLRQHLKTHQNIPFETTDNLLINGLKGENQTPDRSQQAIWEILTAQTQHIAALVQQKQHRAETLYVSGGLALIPQFLNHLQETFPHDIQKFNCWRNLLIDEKNFDLKYLDATAPHFAVAFGMALRAASPGKKKEPS